MKEKNKSILEFIAFLCAVIGTFSSAAPLFSITSKAQIIIIIFSSFTAGVLLTKIITDKKQRK